LYDKFKRGKYEEVMKLQTKINAVIRFLKGSPAAFKTAPELRGIKASSPKRPLKSLKSNDILKLENDLF